MYVEALQSYGIVLVERKGEVAVVIDIDIVLLVLDAIVVVLHLLTNLI